MLGVIAEGGGLLIVVSIFPSDITVFSVRIVSSSAKTNPPTRIKIEISRSLNISNSA
tara:strand:- start:341 stop:511 length:171 start_codon:yes stop_codon:yes gene_type:complete